MSNKICLSKRYMMVFVLVFLVSGFFLAISYFVNNNRVSVNSKASSPKSNQAVINGNYALAGDYPFFVAVGIEEGYYKCSGSLIDKQWVLTARHCITNSSEKTVNPSDINLTTDYVNNTKIMNEIQSGRRDYDKNIPKVSEIVLYTTDSDELYSKLFMHSWEKVSFVNDIALLKLTTSVDLPTISIPGENIDILTGNNQGVILGIGDIEESTRGNSTMSKDVGLQYAKLILQKNTMTYARSNKIADSSINIRYLASHFLDSWTAGASGDSGGPVIMNGKNKKIQIGMTVFGHSNLITVEDNTYINVSYYSKWITEKTGIQPETGTWDGALIPTAESRAVTPSPIPIITSTSKEKPPCFGDNRFCSGLDKCEDYGDGTFHENKNYKCYSVYAKCCEHK